jgi:hypothetical protein
MEGFAKSLYNLGKIQQDRKKYKEAIQALSEAASIFEELESPHFDDVIKGLAKIEEEIGEDKYNKILKSLSEKERG